MSDIRELLREEFPALLAETPEPPERLYIRGVLPPPETRYLTVVGSRQMSPYGKKAVGFLLEGLKDYPISIVSGLALGVDAAAHRAALAHGLHTVAIPGSGIHPDAIYPFTHSSLADEIVAAGGAVMSEWDPMEKTHISFFPKRNRIMAGMAHATLIIEASTRSGTLITARLAADYGRDLLIVPHSIFEESGEGGHLFMRLGAAPVRNPGDILEALGLIDREIAEL